MSRAEQNIAEALGLAHRLVAIELLDLDTATYDDSMSLRRELHAWARCQEERGIPADQIHEQILLVQRTFEQIVGLAELCQGEWASVLADYVAPEPEESSG